MPRPPRVEFPEALYHVTARGVQKAPIALDDHDRVRWCDYLKEAVLRFALQLYAFVLMDNHFHLFVCTPLGNLGKAMQYLNGSYAMYFNVRHERGGHLFERRYRGILIEDRGHYTEISRYVHLNPVRGGLVERPEEYPWSSYPGYHWGRMPLSWLDYDRVLAEFGEGKESRRRYREYVAEGLGREIPAPWREAFEGWLLGSKGFVKKVYGMLSADRGDGRWESLASPEKVAIDAGLDEIAKAVSEVYRVDKAALRSGGTNTRWARAAFVFVAREYCGLTSKAVMAYLGIGDKSGVSHVARRAGERLRSDREFLRKISSIERALRHIPST